MKIESMKRPASGNFWCRHPVVVVTFDANPALSAADRRRLLAAIGPQRSDMLDFPAWATLGAATGPVPAAHAVEVLALLLQRSLWWPVAYGRMGQEEGAVFETRNRQVGRIAAQRATDVVARCMSGEDGPTLRQTFVAALTGFQKRTARMTPAFDALALAASAEARGISWTSVADSTFVRLGSGRFSKALRGSESSDTSLMGKRLAKKKAVTNAMLAAAGLPVPEQRTVRSVRNAVRAYVSLGREVVVKPTDGNQGKGVTVRPGSALQVARAFLRARKVSRSVLVEAFVPGDEYRLLVVGGRFRAASHRRPARVTGDGRTSIRQLVARVNAEPLRASVPHGRLAVRLPIPLDDSAVAYLAGQGLNTESIPSAGQVVEINGLSNVSQGGDTVDLTDLVHPEIRRIAERAAQLLGIDLCGIDFLTTDLTKPLSEAPGAICEANTQPGLSLHLVVTEGQAQDVAAHYVDTMFPEGARTGIPVVALTGGAAATRLATKIAVAAREQGLQVGLFPAGLADQVRDALPDLGHPLVLPSVEALSWEESIDAALIMLPPSSIDRTGIGWDKVDLAIVPADHRKPATGRAITALEQAADGRIMSADNPAAVARALDVLGVVAPVLRSAPGSAAPTPLPEERSEARVVTFVGDIGFGEAYRHYPKCRDLQRILDLNGYGYCMSRVQHLISESDMVIGNLEVPLAPRVDERLRGRKKFLGWCEPQRTLDALRSAGFTALSLANNHALDCGPLGLAATQDSLTRAGIVPFGAGRDADIAARPIVRQIRIGGRTRSVVVFAGFEHRDRYDRRYKWYASAGSEGVARLEPAVIAEHIAALRSELADPIFVAFPHWGVDYQDVTDGQRDLARALIEGGVDAVIGHGTHSCQRIEVIDGRPVVFGLGNFVWNTPGSGFGKHDAPPFGLVVDLALGASDGFTLRVHPILTDNAQTRFRNRPATAEEFDRVAKALLPDEGTAPVGPAGRLHIELMCQGAETWVRRAEADRISAG